MKKILLTLVLMIILTINTTIAQETSYGIIINEKLVEFNNNTGFPFIDENNRTQVPFRVTLETFEAKVFWEPDTRTAIAEKDGIRVEIPIGETFILVNGQRVENDTSAVTYKGRTYLPIRIVLEAFGAEIFWNQQRSAVEIITKNENIYTEEHFQEPVDSIEQELDIKKDKNIYTEEYLQRLVDLTDSGSRVKEFRAKSNSRRDGLLKKEGKYFDIYYPNDDYAKDVANFLAPHMDRTYMMLTDIYGLHATVEVHLIHEKDAQSLKEGEIRAKERITYVWLESGNDQGGNNLSEFVHEVNHNFFDEANGGATNVMWINEANAKLIPSLYMEHNYNGYADMWSFYEIDVMARGLDNSFRTEGITMTLNRANEILKVERAWSRTDGEKRLSQTYGLYFWSYVYNNYELEEYKYFLRNLGTGDVVKKMEELLGMSAEDISKVIIEDIKMRTLSK